ncbi:tudor domain-containing protein 7B-like [Cheilinus undulatus]|uniref:tudor domain-containing protein 7B-like n=1 Tax=Cheilinus undulatus TaxID=241271 RepID=UPI001BD1F722|nr:tudor domain-containing protein 7B-like [Cheilinus undulatus]XP_041641264.1 tudor domain-containing protein 7B-like [Cheilinus undulatus]XP_041641265.1 tudor domain-containing protein 7B-like [Cheilinus undulatus]
MSDSESIKKMLRSVLQSSKAGVSVNSLQFEYRSLCGENIPLKKLGFSKLEDYLRSIPSVVRLEYRMGELQCFAAVSQETAHIAELVARQKSSKKSVRSQVVNCKMRFKPSNPYMLNVRPKTSLRQPSTGSASNWSSNRYRPHCTHGGTSASGDYRKLDQKLSAITPMEHRYPVAHPAPQPAAKETVMPQRKESSLVTCKQPRGEPQGSISRTSQSQSCHYDVELVQSRMTQLLEKYCSGVWMSKLSGLYTGMFGQELHPQGLVDLDKWTDICMVEKASITSRADCLIYPPLPPKPSVVPRNATNNIPLTSYTNYSTETKLIPSCPSTPEQPSPTPCSNSQPRFTSQNPLAKPTFLFRPEPVSTCSGKQSPPVTLLSPAHNPALSSRFPPCASSAVSSDSDRKENFPAATLNQHKNTPHLAPTWTCPVKTNAPPLSTSHMPGPDILPLLKVTFTPSPNPPPCPPSTSAAVLSPEVRQKLKELLSKYSQGLWVQGLPQLFMDTFKMPFPVHVLDNISLLLDICDVEYPVPGDKTKAILYYSSRAETETKNGAEGKQRSSHFLPSGLEVLSPVVPPSLVFPTEQYPSVLVTDASSSNAVTIRYVGENYSNAQEAMEESMQSFYSQCSNQQPLSDPVAGQLVAVRGEDGEELARAQVMEVKAKEKVKVYYVDYGFSVETDRTNLLEVHHDFLSLPFQATNVKLAGLETFSSHPQLLSSLDKLAVGNILLMETLELAENKIPTAVLYDTSQDEDININSTCLKALQDKTMNNPLTVNATYRDVCVTNICANGIIHCQLPSRGTARLSKLLEDTEAILKTQMTSDLLVSRPFNRKLCLARHKGTWSRAEITNMYGNRVMELLFIDLGVQATVEVTDLREIPPVFVKDLSIIPPQAIKCRLAELPVPDGDWNSEAVLWMKEAIMASDSCKIKILRLDQQKDDLLVYMYLFIGTNSQELDKSINRQLAQSELWQKLTTKNNNAITSRNNSKNTELDDLAERMTLSSPVPNPDKTSTKLPLRAEDSSSPETTAKTVTQILPIPPPLELPKPGQSMDVFVPVACHPGYFVLQPWQDLHKLVVLMGEMILYYNQMWKSNTDVHIKKGEIYAAKIDKNWHRVQVKGILANGFVSVYELDYGKHELVRNNLLRPLIEEFRQLPFQAITAQLAGLTHTQWSEEASMLFRNHVEERALVAQVVTAQEVSGELWQPTLTVYLVDTTLEDRDLWIHTIMADLGGELSSAA